MTTVLGISCYFHDSAAAIIRDGEVVAAVEEERFSRSKHDASFPAAAIEHCLRAAGVRGSELDLVVFYERPLVKLARTFVTGIASWPRGRNVFRRSLASWADERIWIRSTIVRALGIDPGRILFCDHHIAHAASAVFASPFADAATLTVDGVGEWATATLGRASTDLGSGTRNSLELSAALEFPDSLGLFYSALTQYLGFEVNEGEFKVMGLAAYGVPRYRDELAKICRIAEDGSLSLDLRYFDFHKSDSRAFSDRLVKLLGHPPRDPARRMDFDPETGRMRTAVDRYYADVAASVQQLCEDAVVAMACAAHRVHPSPNLAMAGGVALNGLANAAVLARTPFENLYIPPAPGDSGAALGAALHGYHVVLGRPRRYIGRDAYLGPGYDDARISGTLAAWGMAAEEIDDDKLPALVAGEIAEGRVVGWYQGRSEWGPRALGHRSILADPRSPGMKARINEKVKFREQFRPFAPMAAARAAGQLCGGPVLQDPTRFMLMVLPVLPQAEADLGAASHFRTARLQTVHPGQDDLLERLLDAVEVHTGQPVVLNTSFNLKGEPMVENPANAISTFLRSGLDTLVMGHHVVKKS
ncbi:carbamoyltransferase N-terminal domain-containing protein [Amycolatopsis sp. QT-25]|uniref:carbamoyltransferase family protein n=1 Tax=Amycolatopsis sp. QT-25 TaxID=3034022 RepID=UPI0023ECCFDA|nr:carbamoyltransferase N-terminal domain-containing protein [Amycolatopsis sp. QT-25]WET83066.1 carbamoyltransferase N-terminal domain-containing protein [Amycolatopsis sp. QT-25]